MALIDTYFQNLIEEILGRYGRTREGRNGEMRTVFCPEKLVIGGREGIGKGIMPIWLTKACAFSKTQIEGLFFLEGSSLVEDMPPTLKKDWWKPWVDGGVKDLGYFYGHQLRNKAGYFDQIQYMIDEIGKPYCSRRALITLWNADEADKAVLPPCHMSLIQAFVNTDNTLDMFFYQRSADVLLGLPHNIAWAAILHILLAKVTGLKVGEFQYQPGIAHLYKQHLEVAEELAEINCTRFPKTKWEWAKGYENIQDIDELIAQARLNCKKPDYLYDTPIKILKYEPKLKNLKLELVA